ncbi:MAG: hypothetical protein LUF78_10270 [Clostridiales bacterium]|nr:hypothetical protein [Clostridiales bacterium]
MLMTLIKLPLKLLTLPLILICAVASVLLKVVDNLSSYIIGFFILLLILCGVVAAINQWWTSVVVMVVLAALCVAVTFVAAVLETLLDTMTGALVGFLHS